MRFDELKKECRDVHFQVPTNFFLTLSVSFCQLELGDVQQ